MLAIIIIISLVAIATCVATLVAQSRANARANAMHDDTARRIAEIRAMIDSYHA